MTIKHPTPYLTVSVDADGTIVSTPDEHGTMVSREEYDALYEICKKARFHADSNEGMAECMSMFRQAMIDYGVVGESCPPMMMVEGVSSYIYRLSQQVAKSRV